MIRVLAARLLGGHVSRRAERRPRFRELASPRHLREAEVHDLHEPAGLDHDVRGLHVAVNDALAVRRVEALGDLRGDIERLVDLERPPADAVLQALPLDVLHRHEEAPVRFVDLVNDADVGMAERGRRLRLMEKARLLLGALDSPRGDELERDGASELCVFRAVHDAHAARAELAENPIMGYEFVVHEMANTLATSEGSCQWIAMIGSRTSPAGKLFAPLMRD